MALVLNISETGLLLETVVKLTVGETLQVDIPEASAATIRVVWTEELLAGCEFISPIPTAVVRAAQLKSPVDAVGSVKRGAAPDAEIPTEDYHWHRDDAHDQVAVVMITTLIALLALLIFLAAIVSL